MTLAYVFWHWTDAPVGPYLEAQRAFHAALGLLNAGAVEGARKEPHDHAAARAAGGCAGIYLLRGGDAFGPETGVTLWISKPAGTSYATFLETLHPALEKLGVSLWQRQMVLGPTPEFCVRSSSAPDLPGLTVATILPFRRVVGGEELEPPPEDPGFPLA